MAKSKAGSGQRSKSLLINKMQKAAPGAHKKHKEGEAVIRGVGLPAGINRGVAEFTGYKIGEQKSGKNKGAPYVTFTGVVHEPAEFAGLKAIRIHRITETAKKTKEDKLGEVMNEIKLLGGNLEDTSSLEEAFEVLDGIVEEGPFFYFHTWVGTATAQYPNPEPQCQYDGLATDYQPTEEDDVEEDEDEEEEVPFDEEGEYEEEEVDAEDDGEDDGEDEPTYIDLGEQADAGVEEAEAQLVEAAEARGLDPDEYPTWESLGQALHNEEDGEEDGEEEEYEEVEEEEEEGDVDDDWEPVVGDIYLYKPPRKPQAEFEVVKVVKSRKVVNLVHSSDEEVSYDNVSWDKLEGE